jgi:hypothetical protein
MKSPVSRGLAVDPDLQGDSAWFLEGTDKTPKFKHIMKQNIKGWVTGSALLGCLLTANLALSQGTVTVSDFHNFNLTALYANWNADDWAFTPPTITSHPVGYEVAAQGYGSGAYHLPTAISAPGATQVQLNFTLNTATPANWMGPNFDLTDNGNHQVQYLAYNNYSGPGTYNIIVPIGALDPSNITDFNLEMDPAGYGNGARYDITYNSLSLLTPVPEPASASLLFLGCVGFVAARKRARS